MKLNWLQHVAFEGLGYIGEWANANGAELSRTRLFEHDPLPSIDRVDGLVVMGGPMNINDHDEHPWLVEEKGFIRQCIDAGKPLLGICLGAQLIADVLGARVYPGPRKEIGWFPIRRDGNATEWLPSELIVFHWHGDTFDIPDGALPLAANDACTNQGFIYNDRVVGLQFHMETTEAGMEALIENCADELVDGPFIQTAEEMRSGLSNMESIHAVMQHLLNRLFRERKQFCRHR